jgi:preprotein translocase subunit SecD
VLALVATTLLAGCTSTKTASQPSQSPAPHDLQLRPVLAEAPIGTSTCPTATHDETASMSPMYACSDDGKTLNSLGPAGVTGDQVAAVSLAPNNSGGPKEPIQVLVTFTSTGSAAIQQMTRDLATKSPPESQMAIYVAGRVKSSPMVEEPIIGGSLVISGNFTQAQADQLVSDIKSP